MSFPKLPILTVRHQKPLAILAAILGVTFTIGVIAWLIKLGVPAGTAAPIVSGVISAIAAAFSLREWVAKQEVETKKQEAEAQKQQAEAQKNHAETQKQEAEQKLEILEKKQEESEEERKGRAEELLAAIRDKCKTAPKLENIQWKDDVFIKRIKWTDSLVQAVEVGARLVVIASGKGGVGKSTLGLGLLEAFSRDKPTLLVDFDMHNRGLTSLLHKPDKVLESTNLLAEMERFHGLYEKTHLSPGSLGNEQVDELRNPFTSLRNDFAAPGVPLRSCSFDGESILPAGDDAAAHASNAWFLPSTGTDPNERFLSSKVFRSQFEEVYFFLKSLSYWAGNTPNSFHTVIVDCHGAHDHFMIGAIHAAAALLVVTTPEPGGFDGTYDLLAFARELRKVIPGSGGQFPTVLAINNVRDWQGPSVDAIREFVKERPALDFVEPVGIESDDAIRQVTNSYEFGDITKIRPLWFASKAFYKRFQDFWDQPCLRGTQSDVVTTNVTAPRPEPPPSNSIQPSPAPNEGTSDGV